MDPSQASQHQVTPDLDRKCPFRVRSPWVLIFSAVLLPLGVAEPLRHLVISLTSNSPDIAGVWNQWLLPNLQPNTMSLSSVPRTRYVFSMDDSICEEGSIRGRLYTSRGPYAAYDACSLWDTWKDRRMLHHALPLGQ